MGQQAVESLETKKIRSRRNFNAFLLGIIPFLILIIIDIFFNRSQFLGVFVLLIICTGGMGALAIIILSIFIGYAEIILYESFIKMINKSNSKNIPSLYPQLEQYINQAKKSNISKDQIISNLLRVGWSRKTIDQSIEINDLQKNDFSQSTYGLSTVRSRRPDTHGNSEYYPKTCCQR